MNLLESAFQVIRQNRQSANLGVALENKHIGSISKIAQEDVLSLKTEFFLIIAPTITEMMM